jgi:hypothetical protein
LSYPDKRDCAVRQRAKRTRIEGISLIYLNFLPDYLEHINKNAYLCIVKNPRGARSSSPIKMKAAYFVPNAKRNIAATAWASGNTPKGIPLGALTARSAALFIYLSKYQEYETRFKFKP